MRYLRLIGVLLLVTVATVTVMAGAMAVGPGTARAQVFEFYPYDENDDEALTTLDYAEWANMARCLCDAYNESEGAQTATLNIHVRDSGGVYTTEEVYFFLGDACDSESTAINDVCQELVVINHSDFSQEQTIEVPIHWVVDPINGECTEQNGGSTTLYVIMGDPDNAPSATLEITYDTAPPGVPSAVEANGGEGAVTVSWEPPETDDENIEYYNVLCALDGVPLTSPSATESWKTTQEVCGQDLTPDNIPDPDPDAGVPDAAVADATVSSDASVTPDASGLDAAVQVDAAVQDDAAAQDDAATTTIDCNSVSGGFTAGTTYPNPCFVCGTAGVSASDLRISGLDNNVIYDFAVVAIDEKGNVSAVSEVVSATPVMTTDFAEHYAAAGGVEEGGFCFIATAVYGDYDHPDVRSLRSYRDQVLKRSTGGQRFIGWYYAHGPKMVQLQRHSPLVWAATRLGVEGLVWISRQLTVGQPGGADPQRAALPLGLLLMGMMLGLSRLVGRREEEREAADGEDPAKDASDLEVTP